MTKSTIIKILSQICGRNRKSNCWRPTPNSNEQQLFHSLSEKATIELPPLARMAAEAHSMETVIFCGTGAATNGSRARPTKNRFASEDFKRTAGTAP